jgi:hypothetical protein
MSDTTEVATEITVKRYQCRHIFSDGHRCGSPCLTHEPFCYYHHTTRRPAGNFRGRAAQHAEFDIPIPEDRSGIQLSIGEVLRRIARNEIDPKRAGLLLYGLQIASLNLARQAEPARDKELIEEVTADPELGTLAPEAELIQRKGFAQTLIEKFQRQQEEERQKAAAKAAEQAAANAAKPPSKCPDLNSIAVRPTSMSSASIGNASYSVGTQEVYSPHESGFAEQQRHKSIATMVPLRR